EDGIRDLIVTGVQTCALPICYPPDTAVRSGVNRKLTAKFVEPARATNVQPQTVQNTDQSCPTVIYASGLRRVGRGKCTSIFRNRSEERRVGKESRSRRVSGC